MRLFIMLILWSFSLEVFSANKKISCPYLDSNSGTTAGKLDGGAWRIDSLIFDTDDFTKDAPRATFIMNLGYVLPDSDPVYRENKYLVEFSTSPTHLTFSQDGDGYSINRSSLLMTPPAWFKKGAVQCSISDVDIPKNRAF